MQHESNPVIASKMRASRTTDTRKLQDQRSKNKNIEKKPRQNYRSAIPKWVRGQSKRTKITFAVAAVVAGVGAVGVAPQFFREDGPQSLGVASEELAIQDVRPVEELSFAPFYPSDYEDRGIVFAQRQRGETDYVSYTDVLDGVPFTVTQQRATEDIAGGDIAQLENLGKSLPEPAERYFRVDDTVVFISSDNSTRQSLIFAKEEVLIFVTAEEAIREFTWVTYISNLIQ